MMISHTHKCIMLKPRKTGGTSIQKALFGITEGNHESLSEIKREAGAIWHKYFKFVFVRNPWDMMVSRYHFNIMKHADDPFLPNDFKDWLHSWLRYRQGKGHTNADLHHQHLYILQDEEVAVDYIGRFENLNHDFTQLCQRLGFPSPNLPHLHKTDHSHYSTYYDRESSGWVRQFFKKDIRLLRYARVKML